VLAHVWSRQTATKLVHAGLAGFHDVVPMVPVETLALKMLIVILVNVGVVYSANVCPSAILLAS